MEVIYILIPISVVLLVIAVGIFLWAVNSEQFEDLDTPAWRILRDDKERNSKNRDNDRARDTSNCSQHNDVSGNSNDG